METSNWRPVQGANGVVDNSSMESGDRRAQLQAESRQTVVNKIMDILKKHVPVSGDEGLRELKKTAAWFEEKTYTAATSRSDYLRKISLKMISMQSNYTSNTLNPSDSDPTAQTGKPNGGELQEEVYQKVTDTSGISGDSSGESGGWTAQLQADSRQRILDKIMDTYKRHRSYSGDEGLQKLKKKATLFEEKSYTAATSQSDYLQKITVKMLTNEVKSQNHIPSAMQSNGGDWQEELYQKIKAMKDLYLADLNNIHRKILAKLQQHDSLPQQPNNGQLEKLRVLKTAMEHLIQILQIPKQGILTNFNDKLLMYEPQIVSLINNYRRKQAAPKPQPQALPPPQIHSVQKQSQPTLSQQNAELDMSYWRHTQGGSGDFMESGNWKAKMTADSRQRIADKITDSLKIHLLYYGFEGIPELKKISEKFEEGVYAAATSQSDYLEKICLKTMDLETKQQFYRPDAYMH